METLDLDIENYDLEDILNLFKLDYHFTENNLKESYRIVLKTHPDKSGLKKEVFLFFKQAYSILKKIYYFRNRKQTCTHTNEYVIEKNKEHELLLRKLDGKSVKDFNKWFNEMFEKNKVSDDDFDKGYEDWYRNGEVQNVEKVSSMRDFGRVFENKKKECKSLVLRKDISELQNNNGYSLSREAPNEYSSDLFSKLKYEDLKKAHTETVVPVTREDFNNKKQFNSVDNYRRYREQQNTKALSLEQSKRLLQQKKESMSEVDSRRIYNILKRDEEVERANIKWWANLRQLKN